MNNHHSTVSQTNTFREVPEHMYSTVVGKDKNPHALNI